MTEKRFCVEKQIFDGYCIVDNHFEGYYAYEKQDLEKLCEILNDLSEENEQLKKQLRNSVKQIRKDTDIIFELEEKIKELNGDLNE